MPQTNPYTRGDEITIQYQSLSHPNSGPTERRGLVWTIFDDTARLVVERFDQPELVWMVDVDLTTHTVTKVADDQRQIGEDAYLELADS